MHIVLTGATGMIGSAIIREAVKQDYEITCLVRRDSSRILNILKSPNVHIVECAISEYNFIKLEGQYDIFMHLAWDKTSVEGRDDVNTQVLNIQYTLDAVRLAHKCGCKVFIGAGSQAEYGLKQEPLSSNLPVNPESGYGIAKFTAGKLSSILCKQLGLRFNWMRILSVYGPNDGYNTLINYCLRELKASRSPELTKCEQMWDYLHCDDAARAFLAVSQNGIDGKIYPLGSGKGKRLREYVECLRDCVNPNIKLIFGKKPYYEHQPMYLVADISDLTEDTGWRPIITFKEYFQGEINNDK